VLEADGVISVLVVDDSVVIRRLITEALASDRRIQVAGTASNGRIALTKVAQLRPDIVTLDIEMPVMDGLETLRNLRPRYPRLPIIMFSTLTASGATATLDALAAGATDYVTKPANVGSIRESIRSVREQLIPRIHALCAPQARAASPIQGRPYGPGGGTFYGRRAGPPTAGGAALGERVSPPGPTRPRPGSGRRTAAGVPIPTGTPGGLVPPAGAAPDGAQATTVERRTDRVDIVTIGCSTGGPDALSKLLRALPARLPVPIVVVQHMPPVFTRMFAERLDKTCALSVVEASDNLAITPGSVYIAPGDLHLEVVRRGNDVATRLHSGPPENFCRPAVDVLFRSVAKAYGKGALALVLTGMGQDGRKACELLHQAGAEIVAQDEATSVVWGMPGAVTNAGLADVVLPLEDLARHVVVRVTGGRRLPSPEVTR
jgi:two-component system chemotaxis response regulator CheB